MPIDWSGSYNGLSWGPSTKLHAVKWEGLFSPPPSRISDAVRLGADGSFFGRDLYGSRVITLTAHLVANDASDFDSQANAIEAAMVIQRDTSVPLLVGNYMLNVRPVDWNIPRAAENTDRYALVTLQWRAADPFIYDANETVVQVGMQLGLAGWTFPWTFPWTFSPNPSAVVSPASVFNSGTIESAPWMQIWGPVDVGFELRNLTTGAVFQAALPLSNTDWVDVDMGTESILFQSFSNRRDTLIKGTDFFRLVPGSNSIKFSSLGATNTAVAYIHYRSAFLKLR